MSSQRGTAEQHIIPCEGLRELQVMSARMDAEIQTTKEYQAIQNGAARRTEANSQRIETKLDGSIESRQKQIDSVQKQMSDNHTAILDRLSTRDRQTLFLLAGIVIVMRAPDIIAFGDALAKIIGGR